MTEAELKAQLVKAAKVAAKEYDTAYRRYLCCPPDHRLKKPARRGNTVLVLTPVDPTPKAFG